MLLSIYKIVSIIEIAEFDNEYHSHSTSFQMFIWEIGLESITKTIQIEIDKERIEQFKRQWKKHTIIDSSTNNFVFIPEYNVKKPFDLYTMIKYNNSEEGFFEQMEINFLILCDKVGSNLQIRK